MRRVRRYVFQLTLDSPNNEPELSRAYNGLFEMASVCGVGRRVLSDPWVFGREDLGCDK